nr:MAG TPA: hypothetical protein [Caudoviricetes sp.]
MGMYAGLSRAETMQATQGEIVDLWAWRIEYDELATAKGGAMLWRPGR